METVDLNKSTNTTICVFGAPGVGKTRFIATASKTMNTLILDIDDGTKTVKYMPEEVHNKENLTIVKMTSFTDLDKIYKLALKNDPQTWTTALGKLVTKPFECIAFDTFSELQSVMIDEIRPGDSLLALGDVKKLQQLQIQDWGKVAELTKLTIKAFKQLPITFIASFHEQLLKDELSGAIYGIPSLNGKIAAEIGKYFDIMGHMVLTQEGKYALATKGHARWQAKSRIPCDTMIVDPTMQKLLNLL